MDNQNKCKHCEKPIEDGRYNKKFCSGGQCKNAFHNRKRSKYYYLTKKINNALLKNREILFRCLKHKVVPIKHLRQEGYNFDYQTHNYTGEDGSKVFCCYDFCYKIIDSKTIKIYTDDKIQKI